MEKPTDDKPPIFNSFKGWYWFLMITLAAEIVVFLLITRSFQ